MMISFHLPPMAASAAVSGQSLTGFARRVRAVVTFRCLLAAMTGIQYDPAMNSNGAATDHPTIIEMRTYRTRPGMRSEFLRIFHSKSIPAHAEIGMKILGPFLSVEDPDTFFFMRGFPDLPSREPMKAKFYEGKLFKEELEHVLLPMLDKYDVVVVEDRDGLVRW